MRVLIVASYNKQRFAPFIVEQVEALEVAGVVCAYFGVVGKGFWGYLKNLKALKQKIEGFQPDIIHAHFGLSGLLANLQRMVPVVTTYHGSDINMPQVLRFSKWAMRLSKFNILVSQKNVNIAQATSKYALIPCGIDLPIFKVCDKQQAQCLLGWQQGQHVLFAGAFNNDVKNVPLAKQAIELLNHVQFHELKGYTRQQVVLTMCAADCLLMTSFTEGSPQVIKEAMACGCPIVSVDVGDVQDIIRGVDGCYMAERTPQGVASKLQQALDFGRRTKGRERIIELGLDNESIANRLLNIYKSVKKSTR